MGPFQAIILGIIQGLSEFFPVSSSGHLIIFQHLFGLKQPELLFDVSVHAGTLAAVLIYFYKDILNIVASFFRFIAAWAGNRDAGFLLKEDADAKMAVLIIIGSIPTAVIGLGFYGIANRLFSSTAIVGVALLVTSGLLLGTRWVKPPGGGGTVFPYKYAFIIGVMQGIAVIPGISRSGSTIAVALYLGLNREIAARYSFLLCIPAVAGAVLVSFASIPPGGMIPFDMMLTGLIASFVSGYFALSLLIRIVRQGHLYYFAPYCMLAGVAALMMGVFS